MKSLAMPALALALLGSHPTLAQPRTGASPPTADAQAVRQTITAFFDGMRRGDSTAVRRTLAPGVVLHSIGTRTGAPQLLRENVSDFLRQVGTPHAEVYDEQISFEQVLLDADLASVWTPYRFYVGRKFSHCGYNSFQLVRLAGSWRIAYIIDTRRKEPCPAGSKP